VRIPFRQLGRVKISGPLFRPTRANFSRSFKGGF
jgi:hypothetical protein